MCFFSFFLLRQTTPHLSSPSSSSFLLSFSTTAPIDPQASEVGPEGWQSLPDGSYAFRYARAGAGAGAAERSKAKASTSKGGGEQNPPKTILVRASTAGDALAVAWCRGGGGEGDDSGSIVPVASLVLPFQDWLLPPSSESDTSAAAAAAPSSSSSSASASSGGDPTARFKDMVGLEDLLRDALERGVGVEGERRKKEEEGQEGAVRGGGGGAPRPHPQQEHHYPRPPPPHPVPSIGADDLYPPGLGPGMPGIAHPFPGGGIGGGGIGSSQVGPDHPLFGARHPGIRPPGGMGGGHGPPVPGLPPGARWDPINPPGMPGFLLDDFRPPPGQGPGQGGVGGGRGRGRGGPPSFHPDIMPPGPGGPFSGGGGGGGGFGGGFI